MNILDQETSTASTGSTRKWSPYQTAIFDALGNPDTQVLVQAVAGSGKTTTIIEGLSYAPGGSIFLAFNRSIADEIRARGPEGEVKTLNALGHSLWFNHQRRAKLNARKSLEILSTLLDKENFSTYGYTLARVVGLMKNCGFGLESDISQFDVEELIDSYEFDIPADLISEFSRTCITALQLSSSDLSQFDFDDQLYMPLLMDWKFPQYSNVFIDECQDLSPVQHMMLSCMHKEGARICAVGDRAQAIYGFRGALHNSMDLLRDQFQMTELPLSISYRCSLSVIREAQKIYPHILPREDAPEGWIDSVETDLNLFPADMLVMCRNNAPLFRAILRHVRAQAPCRVLTNALEAFSSFIKKFKVKTSLELMAKMDVWYRTEVEAAKKKGFRGKLAGLEDRYETIKLLAREYSTVSDIIACLDRLGRGTGGPTFATIHKAKGLEAEHTYLIRPDLLPSPFAESEAQLIQEANLKYVAVTRAKLSLTYGEIRK